jgi:hypothetical protein
MLFFPERVALAGLLVYVVLWLAAPLEMVFPMAWEPMGYIALCYLAFFLGCLLVSGGPKQVVRLQSVAGFTPRVFWSLAFLGATGMALRLYDKLFLRGISLADSALEARELLADAEAGPLAAIGGLLYPFCYVPLILWWARRPDMRLPPLAPWLAILLFVLPGLDALILLSRSQMLVALSMMYFSAACVLYRGRVLPPRLIVPVLAGLVVLVVTSVMTFASRLSQMDLDIVTSILDSAYGYALTPNASALIVMGDGGTAGTAIGSLTPMFQYYLHGVFEFGLLWHRPDAQTFTLGTQTFAPYVKVLSIFKLISYPDFDVANLYFRSGVFTTFFGPLWIDFGWFGPIFMLGFGMLGKRCAQLARAGSVAVMPLYAYLAVVMFFMPVVNFMISATGMYIINAFLLVWAVIPGRLKTNLSISPIPNTANSER